MLQFHIGSFFCRLEHGCLISNDVIHFIVVFKVVVISPIKIQLFIL